MEATTLDAIPAFAALPAEERQVFAGVCADLDVDAGTTLIREGDFGYAMFAIKTGTAEVRRDGAAIRALGPGDVFGEIAVLSGGRRTASVVATSPMRLITVMNRDVWRLEREAPEVAAALRATVAECLDRETPPADASVPT